MKIIIFTLCLSALLFAFPAPTFAADFAVNMITDQPDANTADGICDIDLATTGEQCSLRAAVEQANNLASNDRVLFNLPANSTVTLTTANGGEIPVTNNGSLEILGTGANNLTIDGGVGTNRILYTNLATVNILNVTLTGGNAAGSTLADSGAGVHVNGGSLTLNNVHVTGNISTSTFGGGGISYVNGLHKIINSTFSGNSANACGGFRIDNGTLSIANSTISNNTTNNTSSVGGGFCNLGITTLRNVTVANNTATINGGGGIFQESGMLNLGNTIVAGNSGFFPEIRFSGGTITSAGNYLIGDSPGDSTTTGSNAIAYQPTDIRDMNPMLGALQNNGGTTPTHALLTDSLAIDAGRNALAVDPSNNNTLANDQRGAGFPRIRDGNGDGLAIVDIGAFEFLPSQTAASVSVSGRVTTATGRGIGNVRVRMTDSNGETQTVTTGTFGYYRFTDVPAGEGYIFSVSAKRYTFSQPTQVRNITESTDDINFVAGN